MYKGEKKWIFVVIILVITGYYFFLNPYEQEYFFISCFEMDFIYFKKTQKSRALTLLLTINRLDQNLHR